MSREIELLKSRVNPLVFGIFGHTYDLNGEHIARVGGSGIFVAPFQTLAATHVSRDLFRTDPTREDDLRRKSSGYFELPYSSVLFQATQPLGGQPRVLLWHVCRTWDPVVTDICLMEVYAEKDEAAGMEHQMTGFFQWALVPPPVGSHVVMLGYPQTDIKTSNNLMNISLNYVLQEGEIADVFEDRRDRGMFNFPGFRINKVVDHGFSGGPVFWENRLCGVVSGGTIDDGTYAASLWPLCLLEYEYPDLGALGGKRVFGDLFEFGVLKSQDWRHIKDRITKVDGADGRPYPHMNP